MSLLFVDMNHPQSPINSKGGTLCCLLCCWVQKSCFSFQLYDLQTGTETRGAPFIGSTVEEVLTNCQLSVGQPNLVALQNGGNKVYLADLRVSLLTWFERNFCSIPSLNGPYYRTIDFTKRLLTTQKRYSLSAPFDVSVKKRFSSILMLRGLFLVNYLLCDHIDCVHIFIVYEFLIIHCPDQLRFRTKSWIESDSVLPPRIRCLSCDFALSIDGFVIVP